MNKLEISLAGVLPPVPTPFTTQGEVYHQALADNLERWNVYGLAGYVVLGSNGEPVYLTHDEKLAVLETARKAIPPGKWMIAGTGCESSSATIELTYQAAEIGADAALVITPHFYRGKMSAEALAGYYFAVADASPIPVLIYNVPKFTHIDLDSQTVARMAEHPNIIGIKDSGGNIAKIADMVRLTGKGFQVLAGSGGFFFPALAVGAAGGIMAVANVAPQQGLDIYHLFRKGLVSEAAELQREIIPLNGAVTGRFGIAGLKAALDMLGYYGGPVRAPLQALDEKGRETLRVILVESGTIEG
ncbi:MAG TPA: dihydrodipicolinate synthase family protein [Deltaproteobacteria bacterium]|nr:dihydrodipicolinate synthase family protein [Deltaproteobacteria bacterium]